MVTKAAMTTGMEMTAKEHIEKSLFFFFSLLVSPLPAFCFELPKDFWLLGTKKNLKKKLSLEQISFSFCYYFHIRMYIKFC